MTKAQHPGSETHRAVDKEIQESIERGSSADGEVAHQYEEGFGASSGIRNATAETGGRVKGPELHELHIADGTLMFVDKELVEKENAGLADN